MLRSFSWAPAGLAAAELFWLFRILAVEIKSTPLRLVAVLDHPRRWEWSRRVRITIAHMLVSLVVADEVCIAGNDHILCVERFVGRLRRAVVGLGHGLGQ